MNTSVDKASKKRKSLGGSQNKTPAKAAKLDVSVESPKVEKPIEVSKNNKSPKKQLKPENKLPKSENGVSPKLNKFKGIKSLDAKKEDKKPENGVKTNDKKKSKTPQNKKNYLLDKMQKRVETEGKESVIKHLNEKIDALVSRPDQTKTSKRTLRAYKFILNTITGEEVKPRASQVSKKQNELKKVSEAEVATASKDGKKQKIIQKAQEKKVNEPKQNKKNKVAVKKVAEKDEDENESDDDKETSFKDIKTAEFEDDSDEDAEEESDEDEEVSGEEDEESGEDEEDSDEDDDDDDDDEESDEEEEVEDEEKKPEKKVEPKKVKADVVKPQEKNNEKTEKKSRYVLFIGNIAYDTTKDELKEHFKRVGDVVDVRIPLDKESNKPRGFAYVELNNEAAYQKALDLNGSQLKNRKIKVEYTQGGNKNSEDQKKQIKAKNFKLHAMRQQNKQGQRGSPNKGSPFKGRNKK